MTREPEAAPAASSFDGTYAGDRDVGGYSGSASRFIVRLNITNGQGSGTMTSPGCSPSPFSVSISSTGEVSGEGDFNCLVGGNAPLTGLLAIFGRQDGKSLVLTFQSQRGTAVRGMRLARQSN